MERCEASVIRSLLGILCCLPLCADAVLSFINELAIAYSNNIPCMDCFVLFLCKWILPKVHPGLNSIMQPKFCI